MTVDTKEAARRIERAGETLARVRAEVAARRGHVFVLEQHLGGCSECAAFVESFRSTVTLLQSLTDADLPEELRVRLKAFLDARSDS